MKYANFRMATSFEGDFGSNKVFDPYQPWNNDGLYDGIVLLREKLLTKGIELNTPDVKQGEFDVFLEGGKKVIHRSYLVACESPLINRLNGNVEYLSKFEQVYYWMPAELKNYTQVMFPVNIEPDFGTKRDIFSVMICGNKNYAGDLYPERIKVMEWYSGSELFHLYGKGWADRKDWRGEIPFKKDILKRTRFSWCYENARIPCFITEKIFDCFTSGCIPVYWGAPDIRDHIPTNCFIDRRDFGSTEEVHEYLLSISRQQEDEYRFNILQFLKTTSKFGAEIFSTIIANSIAERESCHN